MSRPAQPHLPRPPGATWIILPTYDERETLGLIVPRIRAALPEATLLIVDDDSPDGTGELADEMAARDPGVRVLHRSAKDGLARAYAAGFAAAFEAGAGVVVQMDADGSHDPAVLPAFMAALAEGADLVLGSRYLRGGNLYAQAVLWLPYRDLTGGFKAWRADLLRKVEPATVSSTGYVFQIELTWRAHRAGARIREVPITFVERRFGKSKMSGAIFLEAFRQVLLPRLTMRR